MKLNELTEARYYQSPSKTMTPGRVINRIVREVFKKYGRKVFDSYNDKYRTSRRLSYAFSRRDWARERDPNIQPFEEISDPILHAVKIGVREAGYSGAQVSWHEAVGQGVYTKLVVKLPLTSDERDARHEERHALKNELRRIRRKGLHRPHEPGSSEYERIQEIERRLYQPTR